MKRTKIDYGIDLGTTNSAISRMENGKPIIKKTDIQKDTMPSCVCINKKKAIQVGDSAYNTLKKDKLKSMGSSFESNAFIEFKRTMGTDKSYHSSNLGKDLTSEELSAEILKTLKSFVQDESVNAIVITVPAAFKLNQVDATRRAGKLAGFDQIEILQEPIAASMAYGLNSENKNGFWLVFDFGGGTFDAALLGVEEGIMKVIDTEGDNYLGGKNLDFAIVDEVIIPYIKENFVIDSILEDDSKKQILRNAMKFYAEETKIRLSFNDTHNILSDLDNQGEDDNGKEFELDINVNQEDITRVLTPVFQKAIDISLNILKRNNNLKGNSLDALILVGGPTLSPVLRGMLEKQICKPDTSVDPMTVVSTGAALFASTVDVSEELIDQTRDTTKIQLDIANEPTSVETEAYIPIKILADKTEGEIPEKVFVKITRSDNAWSSDKVEINTIGEVIEVKLNEGETNIFDVVLYDNKGNRLESEPNNFSIIQGYVPPTATLPYHIGIEVKQKYTGKIVFQTIKGVEKNKSLRAIGTINGLKTQKKIRPGKESDFIKIPIYQGEHGSDGTKAIYNDHVYDIIISGNDLPALLPENSNIDLTINLDKSQKMSVQVYFPHLDYTAEIEVPTYNTKTIETDWLQNEIRKAKESITELKQGGNTPDDTKKMNNIEKEIESIEKSFKNNKNDDDGKQEVLTNLRKSLKSLDELSSKTEWPKLEKKIKKEFSRLEKANDDLGNEETTELVKKLRNELEEVLPAKDVKLGSVLLEEIDHLYIMITLLYQLIAWIRDWNDNFHSFSWKDSARARQLINTGLSKITDNPTIEELKPIVSALYDLQEDPDSKIPCSSCGKLGCNNKCLIVN